MGERTRHRLELADARMNPTGLQRQANRWEPVGDLGLEYDGEDGHAE